MFLFVSKLNKPNLWKATLNLIHISDKHDMTENKRINREPFFLSQRFPFSLSLLHRNPLFLLPLADPKSSPSAAKHFWNLRTFDNNGDERCRFQVVRALSHFTPISLICIDLKEMMTFHLLFTSRIRFAC